MDRRDLRLLLVDDDEDDYLLTRDLLRDMPGYRVALDWVQTPAAALEALGRAAYDAALVDYRLGAATGLDVVRAAAAAACAIPLILLTGQDDHAVDAAALEAGAADYLVKGQVDAATLERALRYAVRHASLVETLRAREGRFRALSEHATDMVSVFGADGTIRYASPSHRRLLGYAPQEVQSTGIFALLHPDDRAPMRAALARRAREVGTVGHATFRLRHADGSWRTLDVTSNNRLDDPDVEGIIVTSRDVTARVQAEDALRASEARLQVLLESVRALSSTLDRDEILRALAERVVVALGASELSFVVVDPAARRCRSRVYHVSPAHPAPAADPGWEPLDLYPLVEEVLRTRTPFQGHRDDPGLPPSERASLERCGLHAELLVPVVARGEASTVLEVCWDHPVEIGPETVALCTAIAAQAAVALDHARLYADAEVRATHDALTGLPNRTLLHDRLGQALRDADRAGATLALLLLDLDRFKEINDTLGHQYGDALLCQIAPRVQGALRASDTVARLGGDEFAVLLPDADEAGAIAVAQALRAALEEPFLVEGQPLDVGASIGITLAPAQGTDADALVRQADVAMYVAKRAHSGHAVYAVGADGHSPHKLALMSALRQALAADGLRLAYQPKVSLATGRICGVEALVRWPHPEHGFIPPDYFIPLAEQTGLIAPLTAWVLEAALRQTQTWGRAGRALDVAVNLSTRTLQDARLPDTVAALLRRYAVAPERLTLEITESALMADPERARAVLARLADHGVRLSIDDFGTGYSSLGYLKRLPVQEVKIDKSFVLGLGATTNLADTAIVRSVIAMGQALGLRVVAEGVESAAAWELLARLRCDVAQGYYMSRPVPASELERWLDTAPWGLRQASA